MRFQLPFFFIFLIMGVIFVNYANEAYACSCEALTEQEALNRSFASFVGTPARIESTHGYTNIVTFEIEKPVKNISKNMTEIILATPTQGSACGYGFSNNTKYLVHTHEMKNQKYLQTSLCSGNKELGFSVIPLTVDKSVLTNYPTAADWYPIILFLIAIAIISGIIVGIVAYKKRKNSNQNRVTS